jgi:hypothetical protein
MSHPRAFAIGRWIASTYAALFVFVIALEALGGDSEGIEEGQEWEGFAVGALAVAAVLAVALSWLRPRLAARALLAAGLFGVTIAVITAGSYQWLVALGAGGPFLAGAALTAFGGSTD